MLDHLVLATPDLAGTVDLIHLLSGDRPVPGGRHVEFGTANYLLGLGEQAYLEIIGPDPAREAEPTIFGLGTLTGPSLVTWAARTTDIDASVAAARARGADPGTPQAMGRLTTDGRQLSWRLTPPGAGVVPFLIDWGGTTHPARNLPMATLVELHAWSPDPDPLRATLAALDEALPIRPANRVGLRAVVHGRKGQFDLTTAP
ncbi:MULTISPECIES: VOC family protein [unclassified Crossiella]|uniref:VOC family protein n=1 Tax=unclassified Crossiella TaxID=2620835 RepID=UPI001FFE624D|nr:MULTISPECIES: VOC family protein [unclassified Crossiella]MCK2238803.1 VOC family protein [Crossiella sp. S99.2]MCK2251627.1 VOC family protein [Crossiella sp. S99.1]